MATHAMATIRSRFKPRWVNTEMAKKAGTPFKDEEMVQPDDLLNTIRYLLNLSENVCIKDIVFEMKKSII